MSKHLPLTPNCQAMLSKIFFYGNLIRAFWFIPFWPKCLARRRDSLVKKFWEEGEKLYPEMKNEEWIANMEYFSKESET